MSPGKLSSAGLIGLEELTLDPPDVSRLTPAPATDPESVSRLTLDQEQVVVNFPLTAIRANPHQPRRTFDERALNGLAESIRQHGRVMQPTLVRHATDDVTSGPERFELVAGERRWRASTIAGLPTIRAIVDGVDNATSAEMALAENMARDDLNPSKKHAAAPPYATPSECASRDRPVRRTRPHRHQPA